MINLYMLLICIGIFHGGFGANILLVPWPFGSHVSELVNIGEGLADRGHSVSAITTPSLPNLKRFESTKVKFILYKKFDPDMYDVDDQNMVELTQFLSSISQKVDFRTLTNGVPELCTNPLRDQELFNKLKAMKFDIAIVDVFPMGRCTLVLMHRLGLPVVAVETADEPWLLRNPLLPSAWPNNLGENAYTVEMNFWERLDNLWQVVEWALSPGALYNEDAFLEEYFYESTPVPLTSLATQSVLWLMMFNPMIDYPRPRMPNEVHVGGMTSKPAKPLTEDLDNFMSFNTHGAVVVSFGSQASFMPNDTLYALIEAFKLVKYNVIMRYPLDPPEDLPKNVLLLKWLPQNDLLGHKNTKLFVTHCGANGQNEGLYHGVPMVAMPVFAEQPYNAKRMAYHGFGVMVNFRTFTPGELAKAMDEVISNRTYSDKIKQAAAIFHNQPMTPREKAVFWVEHVLKHGGAHLRAHALDMPWYQYLMLDLFAFIFVVIVVVVILFVCIVKKVVSIMNQGSGEGHCKGD